ncbi:MAG TPA: hypothetical protein VFL84_12995 [Gammaproteobacteria bacterium]|nr:hypothetical protein [Gammaproteobacteria bacterium]
MPPVAQAVLQELRMRYQAAYTAYQACVRAVTEATMSGSTPSSMLLEQEAKALGALTKTRASLLAAMAEDAGAAESMPIGPPG